MFIKQPSLNRVATDVWSMAIDYALEQSKFPTFWNVNYVYLKYATPQQLEILNSAVPCIQHDILSRPIRETDSDFLPTHRTFQIIRTVYLHDRRFLEYVLKSVISHNVYRYMTEVDHPVYLAKNGTTKNHSAIRTRRRTRN